MMRHTMTRQPLNVERLEDRTLLAPLTGTCLGAPPDLPSRPHVTPAKAEVFLDAQGWWTPKGQSAQHTHVALCVPQYKVSGVVGFDIRVIMHDNPGTLQSLYVQVADRGGPHLATPLLKPNWRPGPDGTFTRWFHLDVDTRVARYDGSQELRIHARIIGPDGKMWYPGTGWQINVDNGKADLNYRKDPTRFSAARNWYPNFAYTNAQFQGQLPLARVSGTWTFEVRMERGSGGRAVTGHRAAIDPDGHVHPPAPGITLKQGSGPFIGTLAIDTTELANGWHRLVLRADSLGSSGTSSGVLVVPFQVRN
jgi:hypothetical protein